MLRNIGGLSELHFVATGWVVFPDGLHWGDSKGITQNGFITHRLRMDRASFAEPVTGHSYPTSKNVFE